MNADVGKFLTIFNLFIGGLSLYNFFVYPGIFTGVLAVLGVLIILLGIRTLQDKELGMGESAFTSGVFIVFGALNLLFAFFNPYSVFSFIPWLVITGFNVWQFTQLPKYERDSMIPFAKQQIRALTKR